MHTGNKVKIINPDSILFGDVGVIVGGYTDDEGELVLGVVFDEDSTLEFKENDVELIVDKLNDLVIDVVAFDINHQANSALQEILCNTPEARVVEWGDKTGLNVAYGDKESAIQKISQIADMLIEESKEIKDACNANDLLEILDGVTDVRFVLEQAIESLRRLNLDPDGALDAVTDNNNLKVYETSVEAYAVAKELEDMHRENYFVSETTWQDKSWYTVKNIMGKVMKRIGFPRVNLAPFLEKKVGDVTVDDEGDLQPLH